MCTKFRVEKFFKFGNCFQITETTETLCINYEKLVCKRTYEARPLNGHIQIIADNVDMIPIYEEHIV